MSAPHSQKRINGLLLPKAKKALGQHFLTDSTVVEALIDLLSLPQNATVIEVGPGPGILTCELAKRCHTLHAVELDQDMLTYLKKNCRASNLTIHCQDILKTDLLEFIPKAQPGETDGIAKQQQLYIASNLPYQISSPFLFHLVDYLEHLACIALMLQKEVIDRITARPGTHDYGRLSVMMQFYFLTEKGQDVPANAFTPPPAVTSALVKLTPRPLSSKEQSLASDLEVVVKQAFSARRKTLRNTLRPLFDSEELVELGIDPTARPQTLSLSEFTKLAEAFAEKNKSIN